MKKHIFKIAAVLLVFVEVLIPNQVFANTVYRNVPEECYQYYGSLEELTQAAAPVDCTLTIGQGIDDIIGYDEDVIEFSKSPSGAASIKTKKVGATMFIIKTSDGEITQAGFIVMDVRSSNSLIINNTIKQYLMDNFGSLTDEKFYRICNSGGPYCRVYINLNIEEISNDESTEGELLADDNVLAYGDISLEINGLDGDPIENVDSFGDYTVDVLWGGLNLGEPAEGYERNFYVIRLSDGKKIPAEVDNDGNLVFPTSEFGTFAAVYEDVKSEEPSDGLSVPNTGANIKSSGNTILSIAGCMITGIGLSLVMFSKVKKYIKK